MLQHHKSIIYKYNNNYKFSSVYFHPSFQKCSYNQFCYFGCNYPFTQCHCLTYFPTLFCCVLIPYCRTTYTWLHHCDSYSYSRTTYNYGPVLRFYQSAYLLSKVWIMTWTIFMSAYILNFYILILFDDVLLDELLQPESSMIGT